MFSHIVLVIILCTLALYQPAEVHAIIILPALILIPIAKVVAVIMAALCLPSLGIGIFLHKFFNTPFKRIMVYILFGLISLAGVLILVLKLINPHRPLW